MVIVYTLFYLKFIEADGSNDEHFWTHKIGLGGIEKIMPIGVNLLVVENRITICLLI